MRAAEKKQAEAMVQDLTEQTGRIQHILREKCKKDAMEHLEGCQALAIDLGMGIEAVEGEGFTTVKLLEEYCELAYEMHEHLGQDEMQQAKDDFKQLCNMIEKVKISLRNDVKIRKEVVFLPYKAAMWDSLESVWRTAKEDGQCDAYVLPIPYYDKKPDGSFGECHYEIEDYPKDVPVMDYRTYDFSSRHPDEIYIHNPYDGGNFATSVEPFFYSRNLKKYTDKLVYIPYFVLSEFSDAVSKEVLRTLEKFVAVPAVINADLVIVQSERMREVYIEIMSELTGDKGVPREYWEKKIVGSGSPKFERLKNFRKKEDNIPKEWKRLIQKPDGSDKKIVFYNTSINGLLKYNEKYLRKIEDTFRVFQENKEEVVLWWRPHPLIQATLASMRAGLQDEYTKLRDRYIAAGWGIYDETAEIDRAVVYCDAYYGDESSVVELCKSIKKPVMIQNCDIIYAEEEDTEDI